MRYAHVCYRINDIDRSIAFYCGALGFKELKRYPIRDEAINIYVAPEGSARREGRRSSTSPVLPRAQPRP